MALENMIKVILNYLQSTVDSSGNLLYDNTTIVLFSDHNAYYSDLNYKIKNLNKYGTNKQMYNLPFVIFNKSLGSGEISTFCNTYDILPTIYDLYGFKYNKNLTQGYSVFSEDIKNSVFVSSMCGIFDDNFYTVDLDKYIPKRNTVFNNSKINNFKEKVSLFFQKQDYIEQYYRVNFERYTK